MKELCQLEDGRVEDEAISTLVMASRSATFGPGVTSRVGGGSVMAIIVVGLCSEGGMPNALDGSLAVLSLLW